MAKLFVSKAEIQAKSGLTLIYSFCVLFLVNALVIWVANRLFPHDVVLGTRALTLGWALHLSVTKLTVITTFVIPLVYFHEWKRGQVYSPKEWMITYFLVDTAAVWLIARFAGHLGLGISHWWIAVLLGVALDWVQGFAMMTMSKIQSRS